MCCSTLKNISESGDPLWIKIHVVGHDVGKLTQVVGKLEAGGLVGSPGIFWIVFAMLQKKRGQQLLLLEALEAVGQLLNNFYVQ